VIITCRAIIMSATRRLHLLLLRGSSGTGLGSNYHSCHLGQQLTGSVISKCLQPRLRFSPEQLYPSRIILPRHMAAAGPLHQVHRDLQTRFHLQYCQPLKLAYGEFRVHPTKSRTKKYPYGPLTNAPKWKDWVLYPGSGSWRF
jgi:hypothetical protein